MAVGFWTASVVEAALLSLKRGGGVARALSAEGRGVVHGEAVDVRAMLESELGAEVAREYCSEGK